MRRRTSSHLSASGAVGAAKSGPTLQAATASNRVVASRRHNAGVARPSKTFGWPIGRSGRVRNDEAARIGIVRRISSKQCTHVALNLEAWFRPHGQRIALRIGSGQQGFRQAGLA
jgi:hypothetical protein